MRPLYRPAIGSSSSGYRERLNNPELPTSIAEVVADIQQEERDRKAASKQRYYIAPTINPCSDSPTTAHHWVYPPSGTQGPVICRYCTLSLVLNAQVTQ